MKRYIGAASLALALLAGAPMASAAPLLFTVTDSAVPGYDATFQLDSMPTDVITSSQYTDGFAIADVPVTFDGSVYDVDLGFSGANGSVGATFVGPAFGGALSSNPAVEDVSFGTTSLFTGPDTSPTFNVGSYTFTDQYNTTLTVDVTSVSAAPEPAVWALMIAGVAMVGGVLRFGRRKDVLAVA